MKLMKMLRNNEEKRKRARKKKRPCDVPKRELAKLNQNRAISFSQLTMLVERTSIASVLNASS